MRFDRANARERLWIEIQNHRPFFSASRNEKAKSLSPCGAIREKSGAASHGHLRRKRACGEDRKSKSDERAIHLWPP
jgi:hypothetical protein